MNIRYPVIQVRTETGCVKVRDGLVLCFFMPHTHAEVARAVWIALQLYLRSIPMGALSWYVNLDGEASPLDELSWSSIQEKILNRPQAHAYHVDLWDNESKVGGYSFEYHGFRFDSPFLKDDERLACSIACSLPTEYLLDHGPEAVRALALEMGRVLPFSFGYASLAFVSPSGIWQVHRRELLALLERYWGMDLYHLAHTSERIGAGARGAYWLTFLGQPLLGLLGGLETLRQRLPFPEVSFQPLEGDRLLLTLGEWPDPMDTREPLDVPHFRELAVLLEPYFPKEELGLTSAFERRNMGRWLRRFTLLRAG